MSGVKDYLNHDSSGPLRNLRLEPAISDQGSVVGDPDKSRSVY
jgi:hypothetical protein